MSVDLYADLRRAVQVSVDAVAIPFTARYPGKPSSAKEA